MLFLYYCHLQRICIYKRGGKKNLDEAAVLHNTYNNFCNLNARRDRCGCNLLITKEDFKRFFMLGFDRAVSFFPGTLHVIFPLPLFQQIYVLFSEWVYYA